jgi:hypothetical protein
MRNFFVNEFCFLTAVPKYLNFDILSKMLLSIFIHYCVLHFVAET